MCSEKDDYVNQCVEFIINNAPDYLNLIKEKCRFIRSNFTKFTNETIDYFTNNQIIEIAHILKICQLFDDFSHKNKQYNTWTIKEYNNLEFIVFSKENKILKDFLDKEYNFYAYVLKLTYNEIISYSHHTHNNFNINTSLSNALIQITF